MDKSLVKLSFMGLLVRNITPFLKEFLHFIFNEKNPTLNDQLYHVNLKLSL